MKIAMVSLGCAKNQVDSEMMLGALRENGFTLTADPADADVIVINTCGFIEAAKKESVDTILEMAGYKSGKCRLLIAAGCLSQRYGRELLENIPELDGLVGVDDLLALPRVIEEGLKGKKTICADGRFSAEGREVERVLSTPAHYAYLKIADGCDNRCTYCAIPDIRGPYRSRERASLVSEAEKLAAGGVREIILVAQDITRYGWDRGGKDELFRLVEELSAIREVEWIRLLYAYPERVDERFLEIFNVPKVCPYLDLPLQHADDRILRRMGRRLNRRQIMQIIEKLRDRVPGIALRSSFIVGFPGEGEKEFKNLLDFLCEAQLDRVGFFTYSREEGTPAASFAGQVPEKEKGKRLVIAQALQSGIVEAKNSKLAGKEVLVMIDGPSAQDPAVTLARTGGHAPEVDGYVRLDGKLGPGGRMLKARVYGFEGVDLLARPR